ncbi:MAG: hypothetical protein LBE35_09230 [Clostridiales bacterium]|jgi:hypothetical protein|nr:hypothetical protein [Clostridiales bacterium]
MKRLILLILVLILTACGQDEPLSLSEKTCIPEHQHFWVTMHLSEATHGGISFVIENFSDTEFMHNGDFMLSVRGCRDIVFEDALFNGESLIIPANATTDIIHIDWSQTFGELPYGNFALNKSLHCACGFQNGISTHFLIAPPSPPVVISDFGRAAAKEFLSQFPSLFAPDFRHFRADADDFLEFGFSIYDLDDDGMPEIIIRRGIPETCANIWDMYRFIDGEFTNVKSEQAAPNFFYDEAGRLILLYNDAELRGVYGYYYLDFEGETIQRREIPILFEGDDWYSAWWEHHYSNEFVANPTIFGTDRRLVAIRSQNCLEAELSEEIYRDKEGANE